MHTLAETADKRFLSFAPGFWPNVAPELWNDWRWQLKNRVTNLQQLEQRIALTREERAGVILSGSKLALAITPHFFNLIDPGDPTCPIRRQMIPRIEEIDRSPFEMADPCGEDSHMPVPGLVHRYPDRVLFLVTDRCASYCRNFTPISRKLIAIWKRTLKFATSCFPEEMLCSCRTTSYVGFCAACARSSISSSSGSGRAYRFFSRNASPLSYAKCCRNFIRFG